MPIVGNLTTFPTWKQGEYFGSFIILGEPAAKGNQRRLVMFGKRPALIRSNKAIVYANNFRMQCPRFNPLLEDDLFLVMHIWYASRRPDLDESIILDAMQGFVYANDRQIKARHTYWHLDRTNPRTAITVFRADAGEGSDLPITDRPRKTKQPNPA